MRLHPRAAIPQTMISPHNEILEADDHDDDDDDDDDADDDGDDDHDDDDHGTPPAREARQDPPIVSILNTSGLF